MAGSNAVADPGYCFKGGCARCLNGSAELRDTEIDVDYEPMIALCKGCVTDLALAFGILSDEAPTPRPRKPKSADWSDQ